MQGAGYKRSYQLLLSQSFLNENHGSIKSVIFQFHVTKFDHKRYSRLPYCYSCLCLRKKQLKTSFKDHFNTIIKVRHMSTFSFIILNYVQRSTLYSLSTLQCQYRQFYKRIKIQIFSQSNLMKILHELIFSFMILNLKRVVSIFSMLDSAI